MKSHTQTCPHCKENREHLAEQIDEFHAIGAPLTRGELMQLKEDILSVLKENQSATEAN